MTIERDQALAQSFTELFERSGRTQDELAEREGRSDGTANDHRDGRPTLTQSDPVLSFGVNATIWPFLRLVE